MKKLGILSAIILLPLAMIAQDSLEQNKIYVKTKKLEIRTIDNKMIINDLGTNKKDTIDLPEDINIELEDLQESMEKFARDIENMGKGLENMGKGLEKTAKNIEKPEMPEECKELEGGIYLHSEKKKGNSGSYNDLHIGNLVINVYKEDKMEADEEHDEKKEDEEDHVDTRFLMMDIGLNGYLDEFHTSLPREWNAFELNTGRSIVVNFHIFQQRVNLINHKLNLHYGLMMKFNNYYFRKNVVIFPDKDSLEYNVVADVDFIKNKLAATYLMMPVMFKLNTNPQDDNKSFHLGAGGVGGILLGGKTKQKTKDTKFKAKDDFNLNKLRYGIRMEVGYTWINFFAEYYLSSLFEKGAGPGLVPVSAGISIRQF